MNICLTLEDIPDIPPIINRWGNIKIKNILYIMKNSEKYEELRQFFLKNFETTTKNKDRLHTRDIINLAQDKKFSFSDCKIAEVFKSMDIGEHRKQCNIIIKSSIR